MRLTHGVTAGLGVAALAATALVPLYGDPRASAVSHTEWARMLLHGLDLSDSIPHTSPASLVFSVLSWKSSLQQSAERYLRADGVELFGEPARRLRALGDPGEVAYALAVARAGDYRVRVRLAGAAEAPATLELSRAGDEAGAYSFSVRLPEVAGWVDVGSAHLAPGAWTASVSLPTGTVLESVEVAPPCLSPIEPFDGWRAPKITDAVDLAVTVLRALDLESELPPSDSAIDIPAISFQVQDPQALNVAATTLDGYRVTGGPQGLRAEVLVEVPEDGLYTLSFFGLRGHGQRWSADGCHKVIVCEETEPSRTPEWHVLGTLQISAGRHIFTVALGPDATLERLRLGRRKDAGADYVATLRRLGFDPGPDGPITREKAEEAIEFLRRRRSERPTPDCGDWDIHPPGVQHTDSDVPTGQPPGGGYHPPPQSGPPQQPPPGPPPLTPPAVPPQQPPSPVIP